MILYLFVRVCYSCFDTAIMSTTTMLEIQQEIAAKLEKDKARLWAARGRRACSEQGPHPGSHLWGARRSKKRTSAPQMGGQPTGVRTALILRSRRSWPVAPVSCGRLVYYLNSYFWSLLTYKCF